MINILGKKYYTEEDVEFMKRAIYAKVKEEIDKSDEQVIEEYKKTHIINKKEVHEYVKLDSIIDTIIEIIKKLNDRFGVITINDDDYTSIIKAVLKNESIQTQVLNVKYFDDLNNDDFVLFPFNIGDVVINNKSELRIYNDVFKQVSKLKQ